MVKRMSARKTAFATRDTTGCMSPGEGGKLGPSGRHCCTCGCVCLCHTCRVAPQGDLWGPYSIPALPAKSFLAPSFLCSLRPPCTARLCCLQREQSILQAEKCHAACLSDPTAAAKQPDLNFSSGGVKGENSTVL